MSHRFTSVVLASALTAFTSLTIATLSFAGPYHSTGWRMQPQQGRIYQGVRQGQIGPREYRYLERQHNSRRLTCGLAFVITTDILVHANGLASTTA